MSLLFSKVTVTADDMSEEFLVGGIPRDSSDLEDCAAYEDFTDLLASTCEVMARAEVYLYGEGENASEDALAELELRLKDDPGLLGGDEYNAIENVDCILFMDQARDLKIDKMDDFARTVVSEYGARRLLSLLSEYVLENTEGDSLTDEALKFLSANDTIHVRMITEPEKVFALFRGILREAQEEISQYRLFDEKDCEPLEGEKSLDRILVMSVDGIPFDLRTQEHQLALITPELLERPLYKVNCIGGGGCSSSEDLSDKIIGVLREELVPPHVRDLLAGKAADQEIDSDRPPLEIDRKAPLFEGAAPSSHQRQEIEKYMASIAANIDCMMKIVNIPKNELAAIARFAEQLVEAYGEERPLHLLAQYFGDYNFLNGFGQDRTLSSTELVLPNFGHYPDGRLNSLYEKLTEQPKQTIGM